LKEESSCSGRVIRDPKELIGQVAPAARSKHFFDQIAQLAIRKAVSVLPQRALRYLLTSIANRTNVSLLQVSGRHGEILGAVDDYFIFGDYWRGRDPSGRVLSYLDEVFSASKHGTFIDVGANIGLFSIPLVRKHGFDFYLFEPDPLNYRLLCWNLLNGPCVGKINTYEVGLLNGTMTVQLELAPANHGDHRIRLDRAEPLNDISTAFGESERKTIPVKVVALDEILFPNALQPPIIMKIDAQGAEAHIVSGAHAVLMATQILIFEFWPYGLRRLEAPVQQFCERLQSLFSWGAIIRPAGNWHHGPDRFASFEFSPMAAIVSDLKAIYANAGSLDHFDVIVTRPT
jgi:FkbM family methyltransferase